MYSVFWIPYFAICSQQGMTYYFLNKIKCFKVVLLMSLSSNKIKGTILSNDPDQEGKPKKRKKSSIRKNQKNNKFLSERIKNKTN